MHIMPHCAIGPVALAACMHVDMVVPNFLMQEQIGPTHLFDVLSEAGKWKTATLSCRTNPV